MIIQSILALVVVAFSISACAQDSDTGFGAIMTSTEALARSVVSGSLTFVDTLTVVSVVQNSTCREGACDADSELSAIPTDILLTETLLTTNAADDVNTVTKIINLPRSTRTIKVLSVPSASASITGSVTGSISASVFTTATRQAKCIQPMLPILEPCEPDDYPTTTAPTSTPTLVNGTLAIIHQNGALSLGTSNPFTPIVLAMKNVFAFKFRFDKTKAGR